MMMSELFLFSLGNSKKKERGMVDKIIGVEIEISNETVMFSRKLQNNEGWLIG